MVNQVAHPCALSISVLVLLHIVVQSAVRCEKILEVDTARSKASEQENGKRVMFRNIHDVIW